MSDLQPVPPRARQRRASGLLEDLEDDDPILSVVNLIDVFLVIIAALLIAGIALIHGIIGIKGMNGLWLVAFYVLLIATWPTILIVLLLAVIDSFADLRGRLARSD